MPSTSTPTVIISNDHSPIKPTDINLWNTDCAGAFGKHEIEEAAGRLILFFREEGGWRTFTSTELLQYYRARQWNTDFAFCGLYGKWRDLAGDFSPGDTFIVEVQKGVLAITEEFIAHCQKK